jgi:hypothetical protein
VVPFGLRVRLVERKAHRYTSNTAPLWMTMLLKKPNCSAAWFPTAAEMPVPQGIMCGLA